MIKDGMTYRAITRKDAEWIGMAASVAGGFVAVEGPRVNFLDMETWRQWTADAGDPAADALYSEGWDLCHGEIGVCRIVSNEDANPDARYILCVPQDHPLGEHGFAIPSVALTDDVLSRLPQLSS